MLILAFFYVFVFHQLLPVMSSGCFLFVADLTVIVKCLKLAVNKLCLSLQSKSMPVTSTQNQVTQETMATPKVERQTTNTSTPSRLVFYPKPIPPPQVLPITRTVSVPFHCTLSVKWCSLLILWWSCKPRLLFSGSPWLYIGFSQD